MDFICSCGNHGNVSFDMFKNAGTRCRVCARIRRVEAVNKALYANGTTPTSEIQLIIHRMIGGELNYPVGTSMLDIALLEENIYIEYNGGGHRLRVAHGKMTDKQFDDHERARRYALYERGWRELRIISLKDHLPEYDVLKTLIFEGLEYIRSGRSWYEIDIDNSMVSCSQYRKSIDLGETIRFRKGRTKYENHNDV